MAKKKELKGSYYEISNIPIALEKGYYLCHNHIRHEKDTKPDINGFRAWWAKELVEGFVPCNCGWSGLEHYHLDRTKTAQ